jgi:hypothetical protein
MEEVLTMHRHFGFWVGTFQMQFSGIEIRVRLLWTILGDERRGFELDISLSRSPSFLTTQGGFVSRELALQLLNLLTHLHYRHTIARRDCTLPTQLLVQLIHLVGKILYAQVKSRDALLCPGQALRREGRDALSAELARAKVKEELTELAALWESGTRCSCTAGTFRVAKSCQTSHEESGRLVVGGEVLQDGVNVMKTVVFSLTLPEVTGCRQKWKKDTRDAPASGDLARSIGRTLASRPPLSEFLKVATAKRKVFRRNPS